MIKITTQAADKFTLKAIFESKTLDNDIIKTKNSITEFVTKKEAFIYLGKKEEFKSCSLKAIATIIANAKREYQIDVTSFSTDKVKDISVIWELVLTYNFINAKLYSAKTSKDKKIVGQTLVNVSDEGKKAFEKATNFSEATTYARDLQITPPNVLTSESYATKLEKDFAGHKNISVKVLNKKEITDLKMGLLLSVNYGSGYEPRVVVLEYKGNPSSTDKTVMVGKGITFDAGGINIKSAAGLMGMKYDMSGSAIVAGAMKAISNLAPKSNVSAVLVLTDNMINSFASKPDDVWTSMSGKTVEINNTDAEGRLALADGLTYSIRNLKATRLIDVATLTGAVIAALGSTYTGVWTTTDKAWEDVESASKRAKESVWRMPFHKDFFAYMKKSDVADFKNSDRTGKGGSSSAAMFLKQFTEDTEYIHMDVAGTADVNHKPMGAMVRTLAEMAVK